MRLVGEADGGGGLGGGDTGLQQGAGPADPGVGEPGVRGHAVGGLEGAQYREGAGADGLGELFQGGRVGEPLLQEERARSAVRWPAEAGAACGAVVP
ncbi:hypothetical protein Sgou_00370 [Streptomyces gougerotii]|uniref:Uncharacterized protein n=1 Tax=Streptomyces gougerotii TaxID=53448 RepID=A0ABQ1CYJ0_9ACTN|nr:hypothetical protein Sgou_00370 [Streptomyces gougerotii]